VAEAVAVIAVGLGTAAAIYGERAVIGKGLHALERARVGWALAAIGAECVSMMAFALLQKCLLKAGGARLTLSWMISMAYAANAIAVSVPFVGSGLATGYAYRELRKRGADAAAIGIALTLAGIVSTVTFAFVAILAAVLSGNPAVAGGGLAAAAIGVTVIGSVVISGRSLNGRARLRSVASKIDALIDRIRRRAGGDPSTRVARALGQFGDTRISAATLGLAVAWGVVNWLADALCLVLAIVAVRVAVPWHEVLLVWTAGAGASTFSPTPGGLGVVDIAMIAALVAAGLREPEAIAAVLLYRTVTFKALITTVWLVGRSVSRRRRRVIGSQHDGSDDVARRRPDL